jgi:putative acetyltransferase
MTDIVVRRAELSDAEALLRVYQSPRVIWGTLQLPYPSLERWQKRLEASDDRYILVACVANEVIGSLGLHLNRSSPRRKHAASLGMGVRDDWQGKGVGSALMQAAVDMADQWLNITRLELDVYTDNAPAIRLYKKFGFEIEGTLKQYAFREGAFVDVYYMARLHESK